MHVEWKIEWKTHRIYSQTLYHCARTASIIVTMSLIKVVFARSNTHIFIVDGTFNMLLARTLKEDMNTFQIKNIVGFCQYWNT